MRTAKLTGNDLALAEFGVMHMINWHKAQPRSGFRTRELKKSKALLAKLSAISQYAYPYEHSDAMPLDTGWEPIMEMNRAAVVVSRAVARKAQRAS